MNSECCRLIDLTQRRDALRVDRFRAPHDPRDRLSVQIVALQIFRHPMGADDVVAGRAGDALERQLSRPDRAGSGLIVPDAGNCPTRSRIQAPGTADARRARRRGPGRSGRSGSAAGSSREARWRRLGTRLWPVLSCVMPHCALLGAVGSLSTPVGVHRTRKAL